MTLDFQFLMFRWGLGGTANTLTAYMYLCLLERLGVLAFYFHRSAICRCKLGARG